MCVFKYYMKRLKVIHEPIIFLVMIFSKKKIIVSLSVEQSLFIIKLYVFIKQNLYCMHFSTSSGIL